MNEIKIRTPDQLQENINIIQDVLKKVMRNGVDYGVIPGTQKPTLFKSGAEMIMSVFRFIPSYDVQDLSTDEFIRYRIITTISTQGGEIVGSGVGECSTSEEKYAWRKAVCAEEFEATPVNKKRLAYKKTKTGSYTVQQIATNPHDIANTCLKMSKKRSLIDALLTATAASSMFSQDSEDLPKEYVSQYDENSSVAPDYTKSVKQKQPNHKQDQPTIDDQEQPPMPEEPPEQEPPKRKPGRPKKEESVEEIAARIIKTLETYYFGDITQMNECCVIITDFKGRGLTVEELSGASQGRLFHASNKLDEFMALQNADEAFTE